MAAPYSFIHSFMHASIHSIHSFIFLDHDLAGFRNGSGSYSCHRGTHVACVAAIGHVGAVVA
jgi:hypothetical protein